MSFIHQLVNLFTEVNHPVTFVWIFTQTLRQTSVEAERAFSSASPFITKTWSQLSDRSLCFLWKYFQNRNLAVFFHWLLCTDDLMSFCLLSLRHRENADKSCFFQWFYDSLKYTRIPLARTLSGVINFKVITLLGSNRL